MQLGQRIEYNGWDGDWYRRAYLTTAPRWVRSRTPNVKSIRFRRAGRYCPGQAMVSAAGRQWVPFTNAWFVATTR
jgi:hypothetical protein